MPVPRPLPRTLAVLALFLLVPGVTMVYLPLLIASGTLDQLIVSSGAARWLAVPAWLTGGAVKLWAAGAFVRTGRGTPTSADPPKELVVHGLYRYVRNPMYVGGLLVLLGHVLWTGALPLLAYWFAVLAGYHLFVVRYEEPRLRVRFGRAYDEYRRRVPRWLPRLDRGVERRYQVSGTEPR